MRRLLPLAFLAILAFAPGPARAAARYDVAYLWHADLAGALKRRKIIANILGPRVARRLRVVEAGGGYAVVYFRRGDADGARAAAAAHTRVLRRRGLGRAFSVMAQPWAEVAADGTSGVPSPKRAREEETAQSAERRRLERLVDEHVKMLRRQGRLSPDERTAWSVYDFTTGETLVEINTGIELEAASLVKPFLALAFMHRVAEGKLVYDARSRAQMERMIQRSDNTAADWVMRRLGGPAAVQGLLRKHYGDILPGVKIEEYIPASGRTYRNKASARDYSRFLLALWRNELPRSEEIKRLMALPKRDRLRTGVALPEDTQVYSKTGSTSRLCGDMGVLQAKGTDGRLYAYTLIGIIEKQRRARHYFSWLRSRGNVIREISGLVYNRLGALHGFAAER